MKTLVSAAVEPSTINGLFQATKRKARGFTRIATIKTVIFLIAGNLDFHAINPHAGQTT